MYRLSILLFAMLGLFVAAPEARASNVCEDVVVGQSPAPIIGTDSNNNAIYGSPQPIYERRCKWKYGAVAVDPVKRSIFAGWNYDNIEAAKTSAVNQCGADCLWITFGEDLAYIALSDDNKFSGISTVSSQDAEVKCAIAGGLECANIVVASSTSDFSQWRFGALAYDVATGESAASWAHNRKSEAKADAFKSCGKAGCWVYTFQTGYGAIAMSDDGFLFGAWSARDEGSAGKVALKDCEKQKGKKSCSVVATGAAVFPPTFKPKQAKTKK
jgi:Domain of unknown function (DUF4189)